jgi:hypothetical protein
VAIWSDLILKKGLLNWIVIVFAIGFLCDLAGTSIMMSRMTYSNLNFHEGNGIVALFLMAMHFTWSLIAKFKNGRAEQWFHKFS